MLRRMLNDSILDVMYYLSPKFRPEVCQLLHSVRSSLRARIYIIILFPLPISKYWHMSDLLLLTCPVLDLALLFHADIGWPQVPAAQAVQCIHEAPPPLPVEWRHRLHHRPLPGQCHHLRSPPSHCRVHGRA